MPNTGSVAARRSHFDLFQIFDAKDKRVEEKGHGKDRARGRVSERSCMHHETVAEVLQIREEAV